LLNGNIKLFIKIDVNIPDVVIKIKMEFSKMPVYDYKCNTCGKIFEYKQSMADDALSSCPTNICESETKGLGQVQRIMSKNIGLVFKGTGFYLTDYTKKGSDKSESSNSSQTTTKCASGACGSGNVA
jgi:putative FmdB family regulatory protein